MVVRLIPVTKVPRGTRRRISKIKLTREWKEALRKLPRVNKANAVAIEFSHATLKLGKTTAQRFKRLLAQELKVRGFTDLRLRFCGKDTKGQPVLYILKK